jgi:ATP-binding cassette subfamily B protein
MFDVMQYTLLGQHMLTATGRVEKMLQTPVQASPKNPKVPASYGVTFTDVCFSYDTKPVLNNIDFTAREKGMTALVGHSGAGKSTIANLMPLFWDTYSGKIDIGGVDIKDIDNRVLMDIFSFVFQDVYLFNDTIYNNILCGRKNARREDVLEAAKKARCHEFITQLENGYDTTISEGGSSLSGGEKQRISIARAILKNAPIVILDEVTTALDPINESYIQDAIGELIKDKTVIIIAHRLYTIINADCIVVLEKGRIVDMGKHAYLASECDVYRNMLTQLP